jgi:hypothetical protein
MGMHEEADGADAGRDRGPSGSRKTLGRQLKFYRLLVNKTAAHFIAAKIGSESKMHRIEGGKSPVKVLDVEKMCSIYGVDAATTEKLIRLAETTSLPSWWEPYGNAIPNWFETFLDLEKHAELLLTYESDLVPGLLQTPAYHRAIFDADTKDPSRVARTVELRTERQRVLEGDDPLRITAVLSEGVLAREVGGPQVMADQREHLLKMSRRANIDIRILPWSAGAHACMKGAFALLVPRDQEDSDVVYFEARAGGRYMQEEPILLQYRADFAEIRALSIPIEEHLKQ